MKKNVFISLIEQAGLLCLLAAVVYGGWLYFHPVQLPLEADLSLKPADINIDSAVYYQFSEQEMVLPDQGRDIFSRVMQAESVSPSENGPDSSLLPGRFRLTGVVVDSFPQIAVEDSSTGSTYFIAEGREEAGLSVLRISSEGVLLEYSGQQYRVLAGKQNDR